MDDTDNVILFPGVQRVHLEPTPEIPPAGPTSVKVLFKTALKLGARDLVVIGKLPDGALYVASQNENQMHVVGLIASAMNWMTLPEDPDWVDDEDEDYDPAS